jgi:hypothetical protein
MVSPTKRKFSTSDPNSDPASPKNFHELNGDELKKLTDMLKMKLRTLEKNLRSINSLSHVPVSLVKQTENSFVVKLPLGPDAHIQGEFTRKLAPVINSFKLEKSDE